MIPKFTVGEWTAPRPALNFHKDKMLWHCDVIKGGIRVARAAATSKEEAEANAALIASAPAMRAVIDKLLGSINGLNATLRATDASYRNKALCVELSALIKEAAAIVHGEAS